MKRENVYKMHNMQVAPKDGTFILVFDGDTREWQKAAWMRNHGYGRLKGVDSWCISGTWGDEQGWYDTVDNPILWTHLPEPLEE